MSASPAGLQVVVVLERLGVAISGVESTGSTHRIATATQADARHAAKVLRSTGLRVKLLPPEKGGAWAVHFELSASTPSPAVPAPVPAAPAQALSPEEKRLRREVEARRKEVRRQVRLAMESGRTLPYSLATLLEAKVGVAAIRKVYRNEND